MSGKKKHGKRYTEERIIGILRELEGGTSVTALGRKYGVAEGTLYRWRQKFGGMTVSEAKRLRALETENAALKRIVADQALENSAIKDLLSKKW